MAVTVDSIVVIRRSGRPRVAESRESVSTWVPTSTRARLEQVAQARDVSVSRLIREVVTRHFPLK